MNGSTFFQIQSRPCFPFLDLLNMSPAEAVKVYQFMDEVIAIADKYQMDSSITDKPSGKYIRGFIWPLYAEQKKIVAVAKRHAPEGNDDIKNLGVLFHFDTGSQRPAA